MHLFEILNKCIDRFLNNEDLEQKFQRVFELVIRHSLNNHNLLIYLSDHHHYSQHDDSYEYAMLLDSIFAHNNRPFS